MFESKINIKNAEIISDGLKNKNNIKRAQISDFGSQKSISKKSDVFIVYQKRKSFVFSDIVST